jgi:glyoxylase-like metal-dependent hydrolase (beta-lactamase superfamily II)
MPPFTQALGHGIHAIDTGFQRPMFDAAYLMVEGGRAAFIDTGTNHAVPRLLAALEGAGIGVEAVDWVIPTHVHLDHAGGAGALMQHLPNARLLVHPRGARHLIDPAVLSDSARAVYGDAEFERSYGDVVPVPAARVVESFDGMTATLAGRELLLIDTPGHARHHHCIWDAASRGMFCGDTFGISYREFDGPHGAWILPTTTPTQFEPDALRASVRRLLGFDPRWMYITHYGPVGEPARLGAELELQIEAMCAVAEAARRAPHRHAALTAGLSALYRERLHAFGCRLPESRIAELLEIDVELNAQGLGIWMARADKASPGATS